MATRTRRNQKPRFSRTPLWSRQLASIRNRFFRPLAKKWQSKPSRRIWQSKPVQTQRQKPTRSVQKQVQKRPLHRTRGRLQHYTPALSSRSSFNIDQYTSDIQDELSSSQPIDRSKPLLDFPSELTPIYAISIRAHRYTDLLLRMRQWSSLVTLIPGTDGRKISLKKWKTINRLATHLTVGQVGCYESHARVWKKLIESGLPHALILEDDAAISYSEDTVTKLNELMKELKTLPGWDIVYVGNIGLHPIKQKLTEHLNEPSNWEGLYTYLLSREGAKKLMERAFPIRQPVDIYVGEQIRKGNVRGVMLSPPLNFVVPVVSDTDRKVMT